MCLILPKIKMAIFIPNINISTKFLYTIDCKNLICNILLYIKVVPKRIAKIQLEIADLFF